ncbi:alanine--tRNA ligase-related protein [Caldalkalibacillus thermarum]|uniref:alanine--tRNA ligase-related protein n=1 Tax=Caldalkalibacillus thermarum TaxID=296745 RepID=UPI0002FA7B98|nr:alanine--tRNA ligase-related protein [Caldalkalibacillus thermarum]
MILDQTIFYPGDGGQEHDTGFIVQNREEFEVYKVNKQMDKLSITSKMLTVCP